MTPEELEKGRALYNQIIEQKAQVSNMEEIADLKIDYVTIHTQHSKDNVGVKRSCRLKEDQFREMVSFLLNAAKQNLKETEAELAEL